MGAAIFEEDLVNGCRGLLAGVRHGGAARHGVYLCRRDAAHDTVTGALDDLTLTARLFASSLTGNSLNRSGKAAGPNMTSTNQLPVQVIAPPLVTSGEAD